MGLRSTSWDDLRILLAVHRDKSFLVAGRSLGVATSTIARRIAALERAVGRPLVHRGNDGTRLDPDALPLIALGEGLELGLDALQRTGDDAAVSGTVRLSMSEGFLRPVTRVLAQVRTKHPRLLVEVMSETRVVDLARGEADIGIRVTRAATANVVCRAVGRAPTALFASRAYVERRLPTARLPKEAAAAHDFVGFDRSLERLPHEQWVRAYGATRFVYRSNAWAAIEQALLSGMGIGLMPIAQGLALEGVVQLDTTSAPPPIEVFVAYRREAKKTPRVQLVVRAIEAEMRRQLV